MVDTSLEVTCRSYSHSYWYSGEKTNPDIVECPKCGVRNLIPEDG